MDLFEAVEGRRSVRRFIGGDVPEETMEKILNAARWAPSWANSQCVNYVLVRDRERLKKLAETLPEKNPAKGAFSSCSFCIAVVAQHGLAGYKRGEKVEERDWYMFDAALATQNICLAAHAEGLGSVIVGLFDYREANRILSVPQGYETVCLIPVGYSEKTPAAPSRKPLDELIHHETF